MLYVKESRGKTFVVVDAGMNDLMRPVLYGAIASDYSRYARSDDAAERATSRCCWTSVRNRRLFFA